MAITGLPPGVGSFGLNTGGGGASSSTSMKTRQRGKFSLTNVGNLTFGAAPPATNKLIMVGGLVAGIFLLLKFGKK